MTDVAKKGRQTDTTGCCSEEGLASRCCLVPIRHWGPDSTRPEDWDNLKARGAVRDRKSKR
ncbi:hypothetical protein GGTG_02753 [Gaeumannomyces tritici R3-111a-1]|uniref:Uncharacterized protein n=1 Tax=Gaeumannomyces tritici (strain R3-111a-1) TaxID=644352 RepID=J3NN97_GAET3|nr:hypothetical protein GGTG_02753 [Gaeumannomyces tritici R3-111a-1]EJT77649.1 hypothetical protein GGTG_02753 [Gaeumannomyces tritici R3-111a-1]